MNYANMIEEYEELRRENKMLKDQCIALEQSISYWRTHYMHLMCNSRLSESICDPIMKASTGR